MPAKLSIHVPTQAVTIRVVADCGAVTLGRAPDNDYVLAHDSVSRRHARLFHENDRWIVEDLASKNGVRVDGRRIARAELASSQWFAVGDVFCELERVADDAVVHLEARVAHRRQSSQLWIERLSGSGDNVEGLMDTLLRGIVEIAECRRGFLLVVDAHGELRVRARHAMEDADLGGAAFSGSRSAVDRSIRERRAVYLSDRRDHDWLQDKASVVARGIRALASLPLQHEQRLLGVVYADTDDEAKIFSELDAALLEAFAQRASAALAAIEIEHRLARMESAYAGGRTRKAGDAPTWSDATTGRHVAAGQRG